MERWASTSAAFNTQIASWLSCAPVLSSGRYPSGMSHTYPPSLNAHPSTRSASGAHRNTASSEHAPTPAADAPGPTLSVHRAICDRFGPIPHLNRSDFCINGTSATYAQALLIDFLRSLKPTLDTPELTVQEVVFCGFVTQEGQPVADQRLRVADHVAPQGGRTHDVLVDRREGLHHQVPVVLYRPETTKDLVPVYVARAGGAPVGFREV